MDSRWWPRWISRMGYFNNKTGILTVKHLCYAITLDTIEYYKKGDKFSEMYICITLLLAVSRSTTSTFVADIKQTFVGFFARH